MAVGGGRIAAMALIASNTVSNITFLLTCVLHMTLTPSCSILSVTAVLTMESKFLKTYQPTENNFN